MQGSAACLWGRVLQWGAVSRIHIFDPTRWVFPSLVPCSLFATGFGVHLLSDVSEEASFIYCHCLLYFSFCWKVVWQFVFLPPLCHLSRFFFGGSLKNCLSAYQQERCLHLDLSGACFSRNCIVVVVIVKRSTSGLYYHVSFKMSTWVCYSASSSCYLSFSSSLWVCVGRGYFNLCHLWICNFSDLYHETGN